jgi:hypothetical protein
MQYKVLVTYEVSDEDLFETSANAALVAQGFTPDEAAILVREELEDTLEVAGVVHRTGVRFTVEGLTVISQEEYVDG